MATTDHGRAGLFGPVTDRWEPDTTLPPAEMVWHPFAGTSDGHNCIDCINADDHLHKCWVGAHGVPRWDQDRARINLGFAEARCGVCGSDDHDEEHHGGR